MLLLGMFTILDSYIFYYSKTEWSAIYPSRGLYCPSIYGHIELKSVKSSFKLLKMGVRDAYYHKSLY